MSKARKKAKRGTGGGRAARKGAKSSEPAGTPPPSDAHGEDDGDRVETRSGSVEPEHYNPYNNEGVSFDVRYYPDERRAEADFDVGGEQFSAEYDDIDSLDDAYDRAMEEAEEQQSLADENAQ